MQDKTTNVLNRPEIVEPLRAVEIEAQKLHRGLMSARVLIEAGADLDAVSSQLQHALDAIDGIASKSADGVMSIARIRAAMFASAK